jgi:hypothetical protein
LRLDVALSPDASDLRRLPRIHLSATLLGISGPAGFLATALLCLSGTLLTLWIGRRRGRAHGRIV